MAAAVTASDYLRRKADEYAALREEHCEPNDLAVVFYVAVEAALRELAEALDRARVRGGGVIGDRTQAAIWVHFWRAKGLTQKQIAERLGLSNQYVSELLIDPDGSKAKARKNRYRGVCVDCGATTSGSEGSRAEPRCRPCASRRNGLARRHWTRDLVLHRIREWAVLYDELPAMDDWNPYKARFRGDEERARRFEATHGYWPHCTTVYALFGSWNAAIAAAWFEPRRGQNART
jgi:transcriptional regulator with XRE-family HTH domain